MTSGRKNDPPPKTITADVSSSIFITLKIPPGQWIRGLWSVVTIKFEIYRQPNGQWVTHVCPADFRAVRRPDNYRGRHHAGMGPWARNPVYPGFSPRYEMVPQNVLDTLRTYYVAFGSTPAELPPIDVINGKAPVR